MMEAVFKNLDNVNAGSPCDVVKKFFRMYSRELSTETLWYVFKAWVSSPGANRAQFSNEEMALFLDQLIDLVAAAYQLHQTNRVCGDVEGDGHD
jgi:hypothetical protein